MSAQGLPEPPAGDAYDWFRRGSALLEEGHPAAAAELLAWAARDEPDAASIREAWARALFDARRYEDAAREFTVLTELAPDDDYARFGLGLALWRLRRFPQAADHLAMAAVMRPDRADYGRALAQVRATLAARAEAGLDPVGSPDETLS
ncbi:MAG: tetratricopeptide repeat protein [Frankiales bacterium]|nr:tetratricopeptide repeat protein [Frankiales bacterium]